MSTDTDKIVEILLILFFPPLAVWYHARNCTCHVCLNIVLLFPFILPSIIHGIWYCFMRDPQETHIVVTSVPVTVTEPVPNAAPPAYTEK